MVSLMVAIILGSVILFIGNQLTVKISNLVKLENTQIAQARADELGRLLDSYYWQLKAISIRDIVTTGDMKTTEARILTEVKQQVSKDVYTAFIAWADGSALTAAGNYVNLSDRSYFKEIMQQGKDFAIGEVAISKATGVPTVVLAKAIKTPEGGTRGVVCFEIEMQTLSAIAAQIKLGETGYGWIIDNKGLVIAHPTKEAVLKLDTLNADKDGYKGLDAMAKKMLSSQNSDGIYTRKDNVKMVTFSARVPNSPGWVLGLSISLEEINATVSSLMKILWVAFAVSIAVSIAVALLIAGSIANPIAGFMRALNLLAKGELVLSTGDRKLLIGLTRRGDEIGSLGKSLDTLLTSLTSIVDNIRNASGQVQSGSGQLSETASSMSQGASEQASSIEELSASVEELASTVKQNAENTTQADSLSQHVAKSAEESGRAVGETVASMKEIASRVSFIQEIAGQTNLLALNAAIEAARAGDAGKGFAVVASEVRKLAERSQKAAAEISELSKKSTAVAERAGKQIEELVPDIKRTADLIQEIARASDEQSSGAEQIAQGVTQMDQVVQVNASSSEELAATAEELAAQATSLVEVISFFKVGEAGHSELPADKIIRNRVVNNKSR